MVLFRSVIAFLLIALTGSQVMAQDDQDGGASDPAPSGNEQTHTSVGETGAVSGPGRDYDNGAGDEKSTSHDFTGWDRSREDDTTISYPDSDGNDGE